MNEQTYILENSNSFNPVHIFECGQCFRWNKQPDESYTGIFGNNVINVKEDGNKIIFRGIVEGDIKTACTDYFDLDRDYNKIKENLSKVDIYLKNSIEYGAGIRILNQDLWETIISFIISANNNIPRIKGIIERISMMYGNQIKFEGKSYYTFPTAESLKQATVQDLRNLGLGFRDKRVYDTTRLIIDKVVDIEKLGELDNTDLIEEELLKLPGVGEKVAECIMLFSTLKRFDVFPVDVWVRRVMNELYIHNPDENKVDKKQLRILAKEKYQNLAGLAQQYLFYWKRDST